MQYRSRNNKGQFTSNSYKKTVKNEKYRLCTGPSHPQGGEWLPENYLFFSKRERGSLVFRNRCRQCTNAHKYPPNDKPRGLVPNADALKVIFPIVERLGRVETARRMGITKTGLQRILNGEHKHVQKHTLQKAFFVLQELRKTGEIRHKDSISHGAYLRGKKEKTPTNRDDYYFGRYKVAV